MRDSSNSITHLVRIVAEEVFNELWEKKRKEDKSLADFFCETIQTNVEKAGRPWGLEEDNLLMEEIKTAVAQIALNHKRSRGAIESRIRQKELIPE